MLANTTSMLLFNLYLIHTIIQKQDKTKKGRKVGRKGGREGGKKERKRQVDILLGFGLKYFQ